MIQNFFMKKTNLNDMEEKLRRLEIEIRGTLDGLLAYQKNAPEHWKELNTYKESTAQIEILTRLAKLL